MRLVGDGLAHDLYDRPLTLAEAQAAVDITLQRLKLPTGVAVSYSGRQTRSRIGRYEVRNGGRIVCHRSGENLGTVLHELAHHLAGIGGHGREFKRAHVQLVRLWLD